MPTCGRSRQYADRVTGILLIEDAAQAHGATYGVRPAGSFGVAGCFSFYPGKNLGAFGDAGAVVTSDPGSHDRLRSMRDHGRAPGRHHEHGVLGTNSRLDTVQAVVLTRKLRQLEEWNRARASTSAALPGAAGPRSRGTWWPSSRGQRRAPPGRRPGRRPGRGCAGAGRRTASRPASTTPTPCHLMAPYRRYADGALPVAERPAARCSRSRCTRICRPTTSACGGDRQRRGPRAATGDRQRAVVRRARRRS